MPRKHHCHKYELRKRSNKPTAQKVYYCALPDCTHFMPSIDMVVGLKSLCHECNGEFIITKDIVRAKRVYPRCLRCRGKVVDAPAALDNFLDGLL